MSVLIDIIIWFGLNRSVPLRHGDCLSVCMFG